MSDRFVQVASDANEHFRQLELLCGSSRERRKQQRSVIEGIKAITAFLELTSAASGQTQAARVHDVFIPQASLHDKRMLSLLDSIDGPVRVLPAQLFKRASQMASSPGPVAIIDTPRPAAPVVWRDEFVYLDRVQDPGNIGTILRTCAAAGVTQVLTSRGTAFCWAPKVLRAAMGAHFALQIYEGIEPSALIERLDATLVLRAMVAPRPADTTADPAAPTEPVTDLYRANLLRPGGWLFGNEGQGLREELISRASEQLSIDQQAQVESLNVAAAVAICLFEARRQRRSAAS